MLFYRENQSVETVARNLELSEDAVKQRLSRGRKLLHEEVLGFVEGALKKTSPGKTFAVGVLAALVLPATSAKAATVGAAAGTAAGTAAAKAGAATVAKAGGVLGSVGGFLPALGSLFFLFKNVRHQLAENEANLAAGPLTPEKRREIRAHRRQHGSKAQVYIYLGIGCNLAGLTILEFTQVWSGHRQQLFFAEFLLAFSGWAFVQAWRSRPR